MFVKSYLPTELLRLPGRGAKLSVSTQ